MASSLGVLLCHPSVAAVEDNYVIAVPVRDKALMRVTIGDKTYYDTANGVRISDTRVHLFRVSKELLDREKSYTIHAARVILRLPFTCFSAPEQSYTYSFRPVPPEEGPMHICHISDCHGRRKAPADSAAFFGKDLNLLILNGDIQDYSATIDQILLPYQIASDVTGGEIPVIFSRGNHDLRGAAAEKMSLLYPTANGRSYFYVRLGAFWFLLLDCGEDKRDTHPEYGGTAAYEPWRVEQTEYLHKLAESGVYRDAGIRHRMVISHVPFAIRNLEDCRGEKTPFDIENDIYNEWVRVMNEQIHPELMIAGHFHQTEVVPKDAPRNSRALQCDILIGGKPGSKDEYTSANLTVQDSLCLIAYVNQSGNIVKRDTIDLHIEK